MKNNWDSALQIVCHCRQLFNNSPIIAASWGTLRHCKKSGQNPQGTAAAPAPCFLPRDEEGARRGQAAARRAPGRDRSALPEGLPCLPHPPAPSLTYRVVQSHFGFSFLWDTGRLSASVSSSVDVIKRSVMGGSFSGSAGLSKEHLPAALGADSALPACTYKVCVRCAHDVRETGALSTISPRFSSQQWTRCLEYFAFLDFAVPSSDLLQGLHVTRFTGLLGDTESGSLCTNHR